MMMCSKCNQRPAVVFVSQSSDAQKTEGYCLVCAKELGIKPVNDLMEKMGITEEMMESMESEINELMNMNMMEPVGDENDDNRDGDNGFTPGGAATFPFLKNIFPSMEGDPAEQTRRMLPAKGKAKKKAIGKSVSIWICTATI